jgi:probable HAF family extracellular repeat protein
MNFAAERGAMFAMKSGIRGRADFLFLVVSFVFASTVAPCHASPGSPSYSVIPLGGTATEFDVEWPADHVQPSRINDRGDVIGITGGAPALYRDGTLRPLWPAQDRYYTYFPPPINNRGTVAAIAFASDADQSPPVIAFTYSTTGRSPGFTLARASTFASRWFIPWDMNDWGTIVGELRDTSLRTAVIYENGEVRVLPSISSGAEAVANAINNQGQIIGTSGATNFSYPFYPTRAVIWSNSRVHDLGLLPGCFNAYGADINDRGEAVGSCSDDTEESGFIAHFAHGFIWKNGVMRRIPVPPGTQFCGPARINNRGDVLINYFPRSSTFGYGWWLYSGGILHDVDRMVEEATGWRVANLGLNDMNDRGEIVGIAQYFDRSNRAVTQGILLVPQHNENRARVSRSDGRVIAPR